MRRTISLSQRERQKYETIHHQRAAIGQSTLLKSFANQAKIPASVADFGSGVGADATSLVELGYEPVYGVDIASNCKSASLSLPGYKFYCQEIWSSMPFKVDYGICAGVLQHVPPEMVDDALRVIAAAVSKGCMFQISTVEDGTGLRLIGTTLNLSLHDHKWWKAQLERHFAHVARKGNITDHANPTYWCTHAVSRRKEAQA